MENPPKLESREIGKEELIDLLTRYHVPIDEWGKGSAKTIDHLLNELNGGEALLVEDQESGYLVRKFSFLAIEVLCRYGPDTYCLAEDRQVFSSDGRVRRRNLEMSIGEKLKQDESDIESATKRALTEELGIQEGFTIDAGEKIKEEVDSSSYPGLRSHRDRFNVSVMLDPAQYNADGYTEVQPDKVSYFVWKRISS